MAGAIVRLDIGMLDWSFTLASGSAPTYFDVFWGTVSLTYPNTYTFAAPTPVGAVYSGSEHIYSIVLGLGQFYAKMQARNAVGQSALSAELAFVTAAGPLGVVASGTTLVTTGTSITCIWRANWFRYKR